MHRVVQWGTGTVGGATGMQILDAVAAVCEAPPGFATSATLPLIRSHVGFGRLHSG